MITKSAFRKKLSAEIRHDKSGMALIEFALTLPIFMGLGFYGVEVSHLAITQMKMSQIALNMADNASRIGSLDSNFSAKKILESQLNDVFQAADIQSGNIDVYGQGRLVLSSLEVNADGGQVVQWQRCKGYLGKESAYGDEGDGKTGKGFMGMGPPADRIAATPGSAVMFVELYYEYEPLFGEMFMEHKILRQEAAYTVRDKRELGVSPGGDTNSPRKSTCEKFDSTLPQTSDAEIGEASQGCTKRAHKDHFHLDCPKAPKKGKKPKK